MAAPCRDPGDDWDALGKRCDLALHLAFRRFLPFQRATNDIKMASAIKTVALFGKKSAAAPAKKASAPKKAAAPSSGKSSGAGWLGSNSRSWNPDKWRVRASLGPSELVGPGFRAWIVV